MASSARLGILTLERAEAGPRDRGMTDRANERSHPPAVKFPADLQDLVI